MCRGITKQLSCTSVIGYFYFCFSTKLVKLFIVYDMQELTSTHTFDLDWSMYFGKENMSNFSNKGFIHMDLGRLKPENRHAIIYWEIFLFDTGKIVYSFIGLRKLNLPYLTLGLKLVSN